ncbi:MAG: hypothetical protein L6R37_008288 [Teloschistes peruensis]|nr:MAG: hypothetical protein L6R37_008288 [Teloschistes peruensis]
MEHLVFDADNAQETVSAFRENVLRQNWHILSRLLDFIPPKTPWFGFEHNAIPLGSLATYLDTTAFDVPMLWNAKFRTSHSRFQNLEGNVIGNQVVALLQSWLYLGLLESVVGKKIETSYLVRQDTDGNEYVYSRNLLFCLQARVFAIRANPSDKARVNLDIQHDIRIAHKWLTRFVAWSHSSFRLKLDAVYPGFMNSLEQVIPSIVRLEEAIEQMRLHALPDCLVLGTLTKHYPYRVADTRRTRLSGLGWCPFQIKLLEDTLNQSSTDWLVAREVQQNPAGHDSCTSEACARNDIDESTYQQAHVCSGGQCTRLLPDLQQVLTILKEDNIPVVCLETSNGEHRLSVHAMSKTPSRDYIAISHVWADGLGGSTEGGLNRCQAERLSNLCTSVRKTSQPARFWVDCLCIPRSEQDVYITALIGIRDVYLNASSVLVIDKTIEECTVTSSTEDLYAHIYLSAWMQRMWTYEEAVLAKELNFVLADGFYTYKVDTWPSMRQTVAVVWQSLATQLYRLRADHERMNIGQVYQAFRYRLTNAPQEEFLSVSGILGLDTKSLLSVKGEERTKRFWLMLKWIPFNVPFLDCPKMSEPGFRWAPTTMMYPTPSTMDTEVHGTKSECTREGLSGSYLVVSLDFVLKGCAGKHGSVFNVFVKESHDAFNPGSDPRAVLRLYCTESWPRAPAFGEFNTLIFVDELKSAPRPGEWVVGAALFTEPRVPQLDTSAIEKYCYVGRLLVERLQNHELSSDESTIMFEGTSRVTIDAEGVWSIETMYIT